MKYVTLFLVPVDQSPWPFASSKPLLLGGRSGSSPNTLYLALWWEVGRKWLQREAHLPFLRRECGTSERWDSGLLTARGHSKSGVQRERHVTPFSLDTTLF